MRTIKIGLMGLGTVGRGVYTLLTEGQERLERRAEQFYGHAFKVEIVKILVRSPERYGDVPAELLTTAASDILEDPEIELVVEVMGGLEPATAYMYEAMRRGKHVVTANKMALFKAGGALEVAARQGGVHLRYEAAVAGVIPVVRALRASMIADEAISIEGILNGSTNYILTRVSAGEALEAVIADAKAQGYLEADPTSDLSGADALYKLGIVGYLLSGSYPKESDILRVGLEEGLRAGFHEAHGSHESHESHESHGGEKSSEGPIKLIARADFEGGGRFSVRPERVDSSHPLAAVAGVYNGISVAFRHSGELFWKGRGAGSLETGTAVVGDIMEIAGSYCVENDAHKRRQ